MQITIVSTMTGKVWEGEVALGPYLDDIFREFNRVNEADCERLERMGYDLPSLSAGDFVQMAGDWYLCANVGWQVVTDRQVLLTRMNYDNSYRLRASKGEADQHRPPMFLRMHNDSLVFMQDDCRWVEIPPTGRTILHDGDPYPR